jgi:hypothetical protein
MYGGNNNNNIVSGVPAGDIFVGAFYDSGAGKVYALVDPITSTTDMEIYESSDWTSFTKIKTFTHGENIEPQGIGYNPDDDRWLMYYRLSTLPRRTRVYQSNTNSVSGAYTDKGEVIPVSNEEGRSNNHENYDIGPFWLNGHFVALVPKYEDGAGAPYGEKMWMSLYSNADGITTFALQEEFLLPYGGAAEWDRGTMFHGSIIEHNGDYRIYYSGSEGGHDDALPRESRLGLATIAINRFGVAEEVFGREKNIITNLYGTGATDMTVNAVVPTVTEVFADDFTTGSEPAAADWEVVETGPGFVDVSGGKLRLDGDDVSYNNNAVRGKNALTVENEAMILFKGFDWDDDGAAAMMTGITTNASVTWNASETIKINNSTPATNRFFYYLTGVAHDDNDDNFTNGGGTYDILWLFHDGVVRLYMESTDDPLFSPPVEMIWYLTENMRNGDSVYPGIGVYGNTATSIRFDKISLVTYDIPAAPSGDLNIDDELDTNDVLDRPNQIDADIG